MGETVPRGIVSGRRRRTWPEEFNFASGAAPRCGRVVRHSRKGSPKCKVIIPSGFSSPGALAHIIIARRGRNPATMTYS